MPSGPFPRHPSLLVGSRCSPTDSASDLGRTPFRSSRVCTPGYCLPPPVWRSDQTLPSPRESKYGTKIGLGRQLPVVAASVAG